MGQFLTKDLARGNAMISHDGIKKEIRNTEPNRFFDTLNTQTPDEKARVKKFLYNSGRIKTLTK
jgi:hypothetical protein